jgi:hypothetical protein
MSLETVAFIPIKNKKLQLTIEKNNINKPRDIHAKNSKSIYEVNLKQVYLTLKVLFDNLVKLLVVDIILNKLVLF